MARLSLIVLSVAVIFRACVDAGVVQSVTSGNSAPIENIGGVTNVDTVTNLVTDNVEASGIDNIVERRHWHEERHFDDDEDDFEDDD